MRANIKIEYQNQRQAEVATKSLIPDNKPLPRNISIEMGTMGKKAVIDVRCVCRIETLLSTIEDILACLCLAESFFSLDGKKKE
ncbi:MAG: KEOPS complex subunit Pcc1 [Candidatus Jordarchaeum sp.]|uniref:KEOPS complex subunit Pcc1 n=1 Tax=Candidatus Jordarchaeum sp. TaxID=2823881 RepID=UPI004049084B